MRRPEENTGNWATPLKGSNSMDLAHASDEEQYEESWIAAEARSELTSLAAKREAKMSRIEKRLTDLERRFHRDVTILLMPDGSEEVIIGFDDDLFGRAMREMNAGFGFSPDVDMIRRSISGTEKGGQMIDLCRALLN